MNEGLGFAICLLGIFVASLVFAGLKNGDNEACAKEHNVYECQQIWVPVEGQ